MLDVVKSPTGNKLKSKIMEKKVAMERKLLRAKADQSKFHDFPKEILQLKLDRLLEIFHFAVANEKLQKVSCIFSVVP